jgi:putative transposase
VGTKPSVLTDSRGVPVSVVLSGANTHDVKLVVPTLEASVVDRPDPHEVPQNLCADAAYVGPKAERKMRDHGYTPQVRPRNKEKDEKKQSGGAKKARRWVVEVAHSWHNRFRKLLVRYEKKARNYHALVMLANAIIAFRMIHQPDQPNIIYG